MPLIIPKKLRGLVEGYVMRTNRHLEKGGYFIGRETMLTAFLPIPNFSTGSHANSYSLGDSKGFAEEFASLVTGKIIADLHTHPNGTVPSEQDGNYVRGIGWPYHVVLSDQGERFDWFCVDNQFRGVPLTESDAEIEGIMELVAGELSLRNLGTLFLTPSGELLSTKPEGRALVTVDEEALQIRKWWDEFERRPYSWHLRRSYIQCHRDTGLPMPAVKRAFKKLGKDPQ